MRAQVISEGVQLGSRSHSRCGSRREERTMRITIAAGVVGALLAGGLAVHPAATTSPRGVSRKGRVFV